MARKGLESATFELKSVSPIILHNGQTADPRNQFAKEMKKISGKRGKTDADLDEMARIEWMASLYVTKGKICVPSHVMESALVTAARKLKLGKQFQSGMFVAENCLLNFDGDGLTADELWERGQNTLSVPVRIGQQRVIRTRFFAEDWSMRVTTQFNSELLDLAQVQQVLEICGEQTGLCDWRPKHGRFDSELVK